MIEEKPIVQIQKEYRKLLSKYETEIRNKSISDFRLKALFVETEVFWYRKRGVMRFFWNNVDYDDQVSFLAGAMFLDVKHQGHKEFVLLGHRHIFTDPISKMSVFWKGDALPLNYERIRDYVYTVTLDLLDVLDNYSTDFWVLPIDEIVDDEKHKRMKELRPIAENCLLSIFNYQYKTIQELIDDNDKYEDIERKIIRVVLPAVIYSSMEESKVCLRQRIENYCNDVMDYTLLKEQSSESEIFVHVTMQNIMQCIDIFLVAAERRIIPFIRSEVVFSYVGLFFELIKRVVDQRVINKTLVAYIAQAKYDFSGVEYQALVEKIGNGILVDKVLSRLETSHKLFLDGSLHEINTILDECYSEYDIST